MLPVMSVPPLSAVNRKHEPHDSHQPTGPPCSQQPWTRTPRYFPSNVAPTYYVCTCFLSRPCRHCPQSTEHTSLLTAISQRDRRVSNSRGHKRPAPSQAMWPQHTQPKRLTNACPTKPQNATTFTNRRTPGAWRTLLQTRKPFANQATPWA